MFCYFECIMSYAGGQFIQTVCIIPSFRVHMIQDRCNITHFLLSTCRLIVHGHSSKSCITLVHMLSDVYPHMKVYVLFIIIET